MPLIPKYYGWNKIRKDIKTCPEGKLKEFLINTIEQSDKSIEKSYYASTYIDIDNLIAPNKNISCNISQKIFPTISNPGGVYETQTRDLFAASEAL